MIWGFFSFIFFSNVHFSFHSLTCCLGKSNLVFLSVHIIFDDVTLFFQYDHRNEKRQRKKWNFLLFCSLRYRPFDCTFAIVEQMLYNENLPRTIDSLTAPFLWMCLICRVCSSRNRHDDCRSWSILNFFAGIVSRFT